MDDLIPDDITDGSLPVYDSILASKESERDRMLRLYHGDPKKNQKEKLEKGTATIQDRARKRKYLTKVLERKLEKHVEASLWKESHAIGAHTETVGEAKRRLKQAREDLLKRSRKCRFSTRKRKSRKSQKTRDQRTKKIEALSVFSHNGMHNFINRKYITWSTNTYFSRTNYYSISERYGRAISTRWAKHRNMAGMR